jgi:DNA-binding winged helix-turn-helix (wHTH) protein/Tfp pilus assembly protein PilF
MQHDEPAERTFGPYAVGTLERVLRFGGNPVALAPKVVATLIPFLESPGRVISKAELMERIWPGDFVDEANLTQNIYVLRRLFEEHRSGVRIDNVPKRGYRLAAIASPQAPQTPIPLIAAPPSARRTGPLARLVPVAAAVAIAALLPGFGGSSQQRNPYDLPARSLQHYLLGQDDLRAGTPVRLARSAASFAALMRERPESPLGYAGLAESDTSLTFAARTEGERVRLSAQASALARRAYALDPGSAEANSALGAVALALEHDDAAATAAFTRALQIEPRNVNALLWYGGALLNEGRSLEASALFRRALGIDPSVPGAVASLAWADFQLRNFGEAAALSRQLLNARRLATIARITLASSDVELRDYTDALAVIGVLERDPSARTQAIAMRSQIAALRGDPRAALTVLRRLEERTDPDAIGPWDVLALAAAYARLGRADAAFAWLNRVRTAERAQLARDPRFDALRRDRRFAGWVNG